MTIKTLRAFYATETGIQRAGVVLDVPDAVAERLIGEGFAEVEEEIMPKPIEEAKPKKTRTTKK